MTLSLTEQINLLVRCVKRNEPLRDALGCQGLTYDDLRYRTSRETTYQGDAASLSLADVAMQPNGIPTVSFFAGAGGLDLGFEAAGFSHALSFEANEIFCSTLRANRPHWPVLCEDLSQRDRIRAILKEHVSSPFEGVFHGGPPCQPFSVAAFQRFPRGSEKFKRTGYDNGRLGNLLFDLVFYIVEFKPAAFLIENVPGLLDVDGGTQLAAALSMLQAAGYAVEKPVVLNARDHGIPQDRQRIFVVGFRRRINAWKPPESMTPVPCGPALRADVMRLPNHHTRDHKAGSILRYMELEYGQRERQGRVDRLDPSVPAKTVIAGGSIGGGRSHLHPEIPRTLSPRETALLQTFPPAYFFCGPPARQLNQIGNAVPPVLGTKVAAGIARAMGVDIRRSQHLRVS